MLLEFQTSTYGQFYVLCKVLPVCVLKKMAEMDLEGLSVLQSLLISVATVVHSTLTISESERLMTQQLALCLVLNAQQNRKTLLLRSSLKLRTEEQTSPLFQNDVHGAGNIFQLMMLSYLMSLSPCKVKLHLMTLGLCEVKLHLMKRVVHQQESYNVNLSIEQAILEVVAEMHRLLTSSSVLRFQVMALSVEQMLGLFENPEILRLHLRLHQMTHVDSMHTELQFLPGTLRNLLGF